MIGEWNNGTGRRKSSVARVFLKKGSGKITVNGKDIQSYFGRETSIMIAKQPLVLTNHVETFDIQVNVHGGGIGQFGLTSLRQPLLEQHQRLARQICPVQPATGVFTAQISNIHHLDFPSNK